jgi:glycine/D-amino acid oxidase-like deaminating enzyme
VTVAIVGGGVFGLATAIELSQRGHRVTVYEQGQVPNPLASSTDLSKGMRRTWYAGDNSTYVELAERSARQWQVWQDIAETTLLHRAGHLAIVSGFEPGTPMYESHRFLSQRGANVELLTANALRERFPQFVVSDGETGVFDPWGGYLESGKALKAMVQIARQLGARVRERCCVEAIDETSDEVVVRLSQQPPGTSDVARHDALVICAGAWLGRLMPELHDRLSVTRQQMLMLRPDDQTRYAYPAMPVWGVDPDGDGWYGFPLLAEGVVKIAHEPLGDEVDPDSDRAGTVEFRHAALAFLRRRIPGLAEATVTEGRSCLYTSTADDHFIVDLAPAQRRTYVAGGGSGHGFKFGGSIGTITADMVENKANPLGDRFRLGSRIQVRPAAMPRGFATPGGPR